MDGKNINFSQIYSALYNIISDPIFIIGNSGKILDANQAAGDLFSYVKEEMIGLPFFELADEQKHRPEIIQEILSRSLQNESFSFEFWGAGKNRKKFLLEISLNRFTKDSEPLLVAVGRNITKRHNYTERLKDFAEELRLLNEEKDKFFSVISHDLRNPFHVLLGLSDYAVNEFETISSDDLRSIISSINESGKTLYSFLLNLLDWASLRTGVSKYNPKILKLADIADEVAEVIHILCRSKKINLKLKIDKKIEVFADWNMTKSILNNLLSNAIKFTNSGGTISLSAEKKNNFVLISVADSGVGMDDETVNTLFTLGSVTSTSGTADEKGTGLGLLICKELAVKQGGEIYASSRIGKGSIFTFTLPLQKPIEK